MKYLTKELCFMYYHRDFYDYNDDKFLMGFLNKDKSKLKDVTTRNSEKISELETMLANISNYNKIKEEVEELKKAQENANLAFADRNTLIELISKNSDEIKNMSIHWYIFFIMIN